MNGLERLQATVRFERTDRTPVVAQIFGHAATLAGVPLSDYARDGAILARCQLDAWRRYGHDAVFAFMDANVETEAAGCVIDFHDDQYSQVGSYVLAPRVPLDRISIPDPYAAGRMPELLKAVSILRAEAGDRALVVGVVLGPMTLAQQLMGPEAALYFAADEPQLFEGLLDSTTQIALRLGQAQLAAGAHVAMVFDPAASPAVVPPAFFRELVLPRLGILCRAFKQAGAAANWLHIAGPTEPILGYYAGAGVDIANLDYCVDPARARELLPRTCVTGNITPLSFVLDPPERIAAESRCLVELFADRGGFVLSSGCEIPPEARPENVAAMISAVQGSG
jgi:uroporphyrinogen decarboxylase